MSRGLTSWGHEVTRSLSLEVVVIKSKVLGYAVIRSFSHWVMRSRDPGIPEVMWSQFNEDRES